MSESPSLPQAVLTERITAYLAGGGLFNPEFANHDAVRDLLIDCREALSRMGGEALPAGWQGRSKSRDPDDADDPWSRWREVKPGDLSMWQRRVAESPTHYELREVFAAPTAPAQQAAPSRESEMVTVRTDEAGTPTVWCDPEVADLVSALNAGDLATLASCSGHGHRPGFIAMKDGRWLMVFQSKEDHDKAQAVFPLDINGQQAADVQGEPSQSATNEKGGQDAQGSTLRADVTAVGRGTVTNAPKFLNLPEPLQNALLLYAEFPADNALGELLAAMRSYLGAPAAAQSVPKGGADDLRAALIRLHSWACRQNPKTVFTGDHPVAKAHEALAASAPTVGGAGIDRLRDAMKRSNFRTDYPDVEDLLKSAANIIYEDHLVREGRAALDAKKAAQEPSAAAEPVARDWAALYTRINSYIEDYEYDDGESRGHDPSEFERFVMVDAIMGLLSEDWFTAFYAAPPTPPSAPAGAGEGEQP